MSINFGESNTTRWYTGDTTALGSITGDFTAIAVIVGASHAAKSLYYFSIGGMGAAGSINLLHPNVIPRGGIRVQTATSGQVVQTSGDVMVDNGNYIAFARRKDGNMHCGFLSLSDFSMNKSIEVVNTDVINGQVMAIGELSTSPGSRAVVRAMSAAGLFTRYITDAELIDIAKAKIGWDAFQSSMYDFWRLSSSTTTITGDKGTVLTRVGDSWGLDGYDPIPNTAIPQDTPSTVTPLSMPVYKDAADSYRSAQQVYQSGDARNTYSKWTPLNCPPARSDNPGYLINVFSATQVEYMELWDSLVADHPDWVTKSTLGMDQSGTYPIHLLDFKPPSFENTLIVTCGTHGNEVYISYLMYHFMKQVAERWETSRHLERIRNRTRILLVPVVQPWGTYQTPKTRQNSRSVDVARNWDYKWAQYVVENPDHDSKGSAPFSESETKILRDLVLAHPEAKALIDLHHLNSNGDGDHFYVFTGSEVDTDGGYVTRVIRALKSSPNQNVTFQFSFYPAVFNWAPSAGMYCVCPEWQCGNYSNQPYSSPDVTLGVQWVGNIVISYSYPRLY